MNAICKNAEIQISKEGVMFERVPSAWYDLSCRLETIRAVTQSLPDTVDFICNENFTEEEKRYRLKQISGLADAVLVLLDLASADAERLEQELESRIQ